MKELNLRPATETDVDSMVSIELLSSSQPWTPGIFRDELHDVAGRRYVVAENSGNDVIGFCGSLFQLDEMHITNIAVHPQARSQRIGARLLLDAMRAGIARSIVNATLEVRVSNEAAIALYRKFGFAPGGIRKAYYANNREDALVMWAHDIDTSAYGLRLAEIAEVMERVKSS
jgi:[ribosomal protein S18]-alanine N-acetyltransferase